MRLYPDFYFHSISELSPEFFLNRGISHVIFDIDDTLVKHKTPHPPKEVVEFLDGLKKAGLTLALISNARKERAQTFNQTLNLYCIGKAGKPKKRTLEPFFAAHKVTPAHVVFVGDQLFTDIALAKKWGCFSVLVKPIASFENPFFYLKRLLEKPILHAYFKHLEKENTLSKEDV